MKTKTPRPIKPKPMTKRLRRRLEVVASSGLGTHLDTEDARAILATLAWEREQTQMLREAAEHYALHDCPRNGKCRQCKTFTRAMGATMPETEP